MYARALVAVVLAACWPNDRELVTTPIVRRTHTVHARHVHEVSATGVLDGVVTDIWTGSPIAGITVEIAGAKKRSTITDLNGYYQFANVEPGDYDCDVIWDLANIGALPGTVQRQLVMMQRRTVTVGDGAAVRLDMTTDLRSPASTIVLPF